MKIHRTITVFLYAMDVVVRAVIIYVLVFALTRALAPVIHVVFVVTILQSRVDLRGGVASWRRA
jgi:hypothetical protein